MAVAALLPAKDFWGRMNPPNTTVVVATGPVLHSIAACLTVPAFRESTQKPREFKYTVAIRPRVFGVAASHLVKITRPIEWSVNEPDTE